jgi:hypothetical protein
VPRGRGEHGIVRDVCALPVVRALATALVGVAVLAACTGDPTEEGLTGPGGTPAVVTTPPPPPPAACLLDTDALTADTGLTWTADATTASDTRCVYDPSPAAPASGAPATPQKGTSGEFVAVDIAAASDQPPAAQLDVLAQVCEQGTRAPTARNGFVCRFGGGSVFAGLVRGEQVITVAASAVPPGTTAAALVVAFSQQLDALG